MTWIFEPNLNPQINKKIIFTLKASINALYESQTICGTIAYINENFIGINEYYRNSKRWYWLLDIVNKRSILFTNEHYFNLWLENGPQEIWRNDLIAFEIVP